MVKGAITSALLVASFGISKSVHTQLDDLKTVPNSCIDQTDGLQYLKLLEGDYPLVQAECSNGYTMIDVSIDSDWSEYFTSFLKWHYAISGASQQDHVNWEEWYLPTDDNTNFIISPDCSECSEDAQSDLRNSNDLNSGYYMNANLFGCFVYPRGMPACDFDINTFECHACYTDNFNTIYTTDWDDEDTTDMGACMTWIRGSNDEVDRTFDECTDQSETGWKPTIGNKGEFCVCTKPSTTQYFDVSPEMIDAKRHSLSQQAKAKKQAIEDEIKVAGATSNDQTVYMYASDFEKGTYRIKEAGTYVLMEDVEFDFNGGDLSEPNVDGAWFPFEDDEEYPGYGETRESFFMGFFAGITIECDNVIIDLNGHELKQSKAFFYQQGFFSTIEVESQPFIPGQGVGFFGSDPVFPANVVIKNGNLGRTSHHCIHGNYNENLLIEDVSCYDFSTHGIQLNGFNGVTLRNVDIGPSNTEQFLASEYTHYRFLLPRMRKVAETNPDGAIKFESRDAPVTMSDLADELELKMSLAFKYVMLGEEYTEGDELYDDFIDAKKIFVSDHGYGYGASLYGLFLSYPGANVLSYHINDKLSSDATLENVKIHDLVHKTKEYVGIRTTLRLFVNSFNAPLHLQYLVGDELWSELETASFQKWDNDWKYVGNILTDSTIAMSQLSDNWGYLQIMYLLSDELTAWAKGEFDTLNAQMLCAVDGMIHSAKGTFGLRIDGVSDVKIDGLEISNIEEKAILGYNMCGGCEQCAFEARSPYQIGYAGNMVQGMSVDYSTPITLKDVKIDSIKTLTGRSFGMAIWPGCDATFEGSIEVSNIVAGDDVEKGSFRYQSRPNAAPEACAIRIYDAEWGYDDQDSDKDVTTVTYGDNVIIKSSCVYGHIGCWNKPAITMHGDSYDCNGDTMEDYDYDFELPMPPPFNNKLLKNANVNSNTSINSHNGFSYQYLLYGIGIMFISFIIYKIIKNKCHYGKKSTSEYSPLINVDTTA